MPNDATHVAQIAAFAAALDAYGSAIARWPAARQHLAALVDAGDPAALRLLAEAHALDRLLVLAAAPAAGDNTALAARIVAAAQRSPRIAAAAPAAALRTQSAREAAVAPKQQPLRLPHPPQATLAGERREVRRGLAVMAACMLLGIFVGGSQFADGAVLALEDLTGVALSSSAHTVPIALATLDADED